MTFDELTQAIAGARERSNRNGTDEAVSLIAERHGSCGFTCEDMARLDRLQLLAVIDQLLPDARRYQWLRSGDCDDYVLVADQFDDEPWPYLMSGDELDTAIDRAIEGEKK